MCRHQDEHSLLSSLIRTLQRIASDTQNWRMGYAGLNVGSAAANGQVDTSVMAIRLGEPDSLPGRSNTADLWEDAVVVRFEQGRVVVDWLTECAHAARSFP